MRQSMTQLWELFEPVVQAMGYELVEIEYQPNPKHGVLRLYIDNDAGIQLDDCSKVSQQISGLIDVEDPIPGHFNLEVSSPGLDRPLRKREDFERFKGETVKLKMSMPVNGQRNFKGLLKGLKDDNVLIEVDGKDFELAVVSIDKARLVPDYSSH